MSFKYGIHKEVVEAFVYEFFNNGMGIFSYHYEMMIDFIYEHTDYADVDLFMAIPEEFCYEIETEFICYYLDTTDGLDIIADWLYGYYYDCGYTIEEMLDVVDWIDDGDKYDAIKQLLKEKWCISECIDCEE